MSERPKDEHLDQEGQEGQAESQKANSRQLCLCVSSRAGHSEPLEEV